MVVQQCRCNIFRSCLLFFLLYCTVCYNAIRRRHGARAVPLVAVLLLAAWATVLVAALCLVVLPFLLGRQLFSLIHLPKRWTHDTASFAVGLTLLKVCLVVAMVCVCVGGVGAYLLFVCVLLWCGDAV